MSLHPQLLTCPKDSQYTLPQIMVWWQLEEEDKKETPLPQSSQTTLEFSTRDILASHFTGKRSKRKQQEELQDQDVSVFPLY